MKHINITYHMEKANEIAETCITLPMEDKVAEDILANGSDSRYLNPACLGEVYRALKAISSMQGYSYGGAYHFAEV